MQMHRACSEQGVRGTTSGEKIIEPMLLVVQAAIVTRSSVYPQFKHTSAVFGWSYVYGIPVPHAAVAYSSRHVSSGCCQ